MRTKLWEHPQSILCDELWGASAMPHWRGSSFLCRLDGALHTMGGPQINQIVCLWAVKKNTELFQELRRRSCSLQLQAPCTVRCFDRRWDVHIPQQMVRAAVQPWSGLQQGPWRICTLSLSFGTPAPSLQQRFHTAFMDLPQFDSQRIHCP